MRKKQIVPGLEIEEPIDELSEIKQAILKSEAEKQIEESQKERKLIASVIEKLKKGRKIEITDEMRELNVVEKVMDISIEQEYRMRFAALCARGDDPSEHTSLYDLFS